MEIESSSPLSIAVSAPAHKAFSTTGRNYYFIGFEDLVPGKVGEHIPGNMMGFWVPPVRILECFYLERDGKVLKADKEIVLPGRRIFHSGSTTITLDAPGDDVSLKIVVEQVDASGLRMHFPASVIPLWGTSIDTAHSISSDRGYPAITIPAAGLSVQFRAVGVSGASNNGDDIIFELGNRSEIAIVLAGGIQAPQRNADFLSDLLSRTIVKSQAVEVVQSFEWAKANLASLYFDFGKAGSGMAAGMPEFPWFFSIDTFVSLPGLLASGMHEIARSSLDTLFSYAMGENGIIPHEILATGSICTAGTIAEIALMPTALRMYYNWTGDRSLVEKHAFATVKGYEHLLEAGLKGRGVMEDHKAGEGVDIDTICYFLRGAKDLEFIRDHFPMNLEREFWESLKAEGDRWATVLKEDLWMDDRQAFAERFIDGIPVSHGFWTSIVPFETGLASRDRYLSFVSGESYKKMISKDGLTVDGRGRVMPVGNGLFVRSALKYGDTERAWQFFESNLTTLGRYSTGCFPEISNNQRGCFVQAWSAALVVENLICGFMGIEPVEGIVELKHRLPEALKNTASSVDRLRVWDREFSF